MRGLGDQNSSWLCQRLQPRRQICGVADRGVVHPKIVADPSDDDEPRVEPDAQLDLHPALELELLAVAA